MVCLGNMCMDTVRKGDDDDDDDDNNNNNNTLSNSIEKVHRCFDTCFTLLSCFANLNTLRLLCDIPPSFIALDSIKLSRTTTRVRWSKAKKPMFRDPFQFSSSAKELIRHQSFLLYAYDMGMFLIHHGAANQDTRWNLHLYQHSFRSPS
jgi:hypothetical protein